MATRRSPNFPLSRSRNQLRGRGLRGSRTCQALSGARSVLVLWCYLCSPARPPGTPGRFVKARRLPEGSHSFLPCVHSLPFHLVFCGSGCRRYQGATSLRGRGSGFQVYRQLGLCRTVLRFLGCQVADNQGRQLAGSTLSGCCRALLACLHCIALQDRLHNLPYRPLGP